MNFTYSIACVSRLQLVKLFVVWRINWVGRIRWERRRRWVAQRQSGGWESRVMGRLEAENRVGCGEGWWVGLNFRAAARMLINRKR
jgi:hypothetical protein